MREGQKPRVLPRQPRPFRRSVSRTTHSPGSARPPGQPAGTLPTCAVQRPALGRPRSPGPTAAECLLLVAAAVPERSECLVTTGRNEELRGEQTLNPKPMTQDNTPRVLPVHMRPRHLGTGRAGAPPARVPVRAKSSPATHPLRGPEGPNGLAGYRGRLPTGP